MSHRSYSPRATPTMTFATGGVGYHGAVAPLPHLLPLVGSQRLLLRVKVGGDRVEGGSDRAGFAFGAGA